MGSYIELNDTLQITNEQGFPEDFFNLEKHKEKPITIDNIKGKVFEFKDKPNARIFHPSPNRCFLVHNINGKWLYLGKIVMLEQTIQGETKETQTTSGKYKVIQVYEPSYQEEVTKHESPEGMSYF